MKTLADYNLQGGERLYFLIDRGYKEILEIAEKGYIEDIDLCNDFIRIVEIRDEIYYLYDLDGNICHSFVDPEYEPLISYVLIKNSINPKDLLINKILHK